ncbi:BREX-2 system phosphatase PglZ [Acidimicrobium ferrooxidans]|nr:BREX-2 system phosphatase PglZ [Acidimicrobium ferrooxidans]
MAAAPTLSQIRAQVDAIREKDPRARAFAFRSETPWPDTNSTEGSFHVVQCDSPLAMRIALATVDEQEQPTVLVTRLATEDLEYDILVRLARRRVHSIDRWQTVVGLFAARGVDPRLTRHSWIADALLAYEPEEQYPPVAGGFLDAETAWPIILEGTIGLVGSPPDLLSLLRWSLDDDNVSRFRALDVEVRQEVREWLSRECGPTAGAILEAVERQAEADPVAIGLCLGPFLDEQGRDKLERAAGRLERYTGADLQDGIAERWKAAVGDLVTLHHLEPETLRRCLARGDDLLRDLGAEDFAYLSRVSPSGFDQRLDRFAVALVGVLDQQDPALADALVAAASEVTNHERARNEARTLERVRMSIRFVTWLALAGPDPSEAPGTFGEATRRYAEEGGFIEWARSTLGSGEGRPALREAYSRLVEQVDRIREGRARDFARLLADWTATGSESREVVPVECVIDQLVVPLAENGPVLLLVLDGMSFGVGRELLADLRLHGWIEYRQTDGDWPRPGLAAIPSVTAVSRTSLLCGTLRKGVARHETRGFAEHAGLLSVTRRRNAPALFHRGGLEDAGEEILGMVADPGHPVVGIVINAVDDHLFKGGQIDPSWTIEFLRPLSAILVAARSAGRRIVLTSDHGHVFERGSESRKSGAGERWRPDDREPEDGEIRVGGHRVVEGGGCLIAPWGEGIRYGPRKTGYHGGLSPQEMVLPLVVLAADGAAPAGWEEAPLAEPVWWVIPDRRQEDALVKAKSMRRLTRPRPPVAVEPPTPAAERPAWIDQFLACSVLVEQVRLCGRMSPATDLVAQFLETIAAHGATATAAALSRALAVPPLRLRGLLAVMQRLLNVEGFAVLTVDEAEDRIRLDVDLLCHQFELTA